MRRLPPSPPARRRPASLPGQLELDLGLPDAACTDAPPERKGPDAAGMMRRRVWVALTEARSAGEKVLAVPDDEVSTSQAPGGGFVRADGSAVVVHDAGHALKAALQDLNATNWTPSGAVAIMVFEVAQGEPPQSVEAVEQACHAALRILTAYFPDEIFHVETWCA